MPRSHQHFVDQALALQLELPWLKTLVYMGEAPPPEGMLSYEALIEGHEPAVPRSFEFRSEPLPVTPVGKVRKNVLRDRYWTAHERKI